MRTVSIPPVMPVQVTLPGGMCPQEIYGWLYARGWWSNGTDQWGKAGGLNDFTWEQAVAVEFYQFITLGGR